MEEWSSSRYGAAHDATRSNAVDKTKAGVRGTEMAGRRTEYPRTAELNEQPACLSESRRMWHFFKESCPSHEARHVRHDSLLDRRNGRSAAERRSRPKSIVRLKHRPRESHCEWLFGLRLTWLGPPARVVLVYHVLVVSYQQTCCTAVVSAFEAARSLARWTVDVGRKIFLRAFFFLFLPPFCFGPFFVSLFFFGRGSIISEGRPVSPFFVSH